METRNDYIKRVQKIFERKFSAKMVVQVIEEETKLELSLIEYAEIVCEYFHVTMDQLRSRWWAGNVKDARQWFYMLAFRHGDFPRKSITLFVNRAQQGGLITTVKKLDGELRIYEDVRKKYADLCALEQIALHQKRLKENGFSRYKDDEQTRENKYN